MFKKILTGSLAVMAIAAASSMALAEGSNQDFTVHNETGFNIGELHISLASDDKWGADVLGQDILLPSDKARISFSGYKPTDCVFDVRIRKNNEGDAYVVQKLNLCEVDDVVFYSKDDQVFFRKN